MDYDYSLFDRITISWVELQTFAAKNESKGTRFVSKVIKEVVEENVGCLNQYARYVEGLVTLLYNVITDLTSPIRIKLTLLIVKNKEHSVFITSPY